LVMPGPPAPPVAEILQSQCPSIFTLKSHSMLTFQHHTTDAPRRQPHPSSRRCSALPTPRAPHPALGGILVVCTVREQTVHSQSVQTIKRTPKSLNTKQAPWGLMGTMGHTRHTLKVEAPPHPQRARWHPHPQRLLVRVVAGRRSRTQGLSLHGTPKSLNPTP
jgi:hypothetical protein